LVFYPRADRVLVDGIRRRHDPTVDLIEPHVTVLFPVPGRVGEENLVAHIDSALRGHTPFEVRLGGFHRSPDHWLFLILQKGNRAVKKLYSALYTGLLAEFRRDDLEFIPHLGLGLFLKEGATYNWNDPRSYDLDLESCQAVQREVEARGAGWNSVVDTLHLVTIPDEVLEWASGARPNFPKSSRVEEVRKFHLRASSSSV
jgi:2'-5' RNA ligase